MSDYYAVLEVNKSASPEELKRSYRRLARKYHPDNKETGNEERFKSIQEAYETLSDPEKRALYDRVGHQAYASGGRPGAGGAGGFYANDDLFDQFEDIFSSFFGGSNMRSGGTSGSRSRNQAKRGADLQQTIEIEFLEACFGLQKRSKVRRETLCATCHGTGADPQHKPTDCTSCSGTGEIRTTAQSFLGMITQVSACPTCHGTGKIITHPCNTCKGRAFIQQTDELDVQIPPGVESGMRLLLHGKGNDGLNGGPAGDLYLGIRVREHAHYQRDGLDILEEYPITVWQAIMGGEINVQTIHGNESIKLEAGTQSDTVLTIRGSGIRLPNGRKGHHYLKLKVKIPKKKELSKELRELIESQASSHDNTKEKDKDKDSGSMFGKIFGKE